MQSSSRRLSPALTHNHGLRGCRKGGYLTNRLSKLWLLFAGTISHVQLPINFGGVHITVSFTLPRRLTFRDLHCVFPCTAHNRLVRHCGNVPGHPYCRRSFVDGRSAQYVEPHDPRGSRDTHRLQCITAADGSRTAMLPNVPGLPRVIKSSRSRAILPTWRTKAGPPAQPPAT